MVLGIDFDNTIVRYDALFHRVAVERGWIPADVPARKKDVRDRLRQQGQEQDWTALQGYIYGPRMAEAQPFPGVLDFFAQAVRRKLPIFIISHKTRTPAVGPAYDLHQAARGWLELQGFFDPARIGLARDHVCFAPTRQEKIDLIRASHCTHFIDDLEETFLEPDFPTGVERILFGHTEAPAGLKGIRLAEDWAQVSKHVFDQSI
jgi:hypothetical protein